jgi:predicted Zn-dependent protease
MTYLPSSSNSHVPRLKVVWLHELGHSIGLGHVSTLKRVMYTSASDAYFAGVTSLTSDEIAGVNSIY